MNKWQSIETAPKDGARVLLYEKEKVQIGWYVDSVEISYGKREREIKYWFIEGRALFFGALDAAPTHWMPLPEPPK